MPKEKMKNDAYYLYDCLGEERVERFAKVIEKVTKVKLERPLKARDEFSPGEDLPPITMHFEEESEHLVFSTARAPRNMKLLKKWVKRAREEFPFDFRPMLSRPYHHYRIAYSMTTLGAERMRERFGKVVERLIRQGKLNEEDVDRDLRIPLIDTTKRGGWFYDVPRDEDLESIFEVLLWVNERVWEEWEQLKREGRAVEMPNYLYEYLGEDRVERLARIMEKVIGKKLERPIRPRDLYSPEDEFPPIVIDSYTSGTAVDFEALEFGPARTIPYGTFLALKWRKEANKRFKVELKLATGGHGVAYRTWFSLVIRPEEFDLDDMSDEEIERNLKAMLWANEKLREEWEVMRAKGLIREPPSYLYDCLGEQQVERLAEILERVLRVKLMRPGIWQTVEGKEAKIQVDRFGDEFIQMIYSAEPDRRRELIPNWIEKANERFETDLSRVNMDITYLIRIDEIGEISDDEIERNLTAMFWVEERAAEELREKED